jgi:SAM-dependent methyltransferase
MKSLLIGCGAQRDRRILVNGFEEWGELVTLDLNPDHQPDVVHDLEVLPYPFGDNEFDEIHAYEVLEHTGAQGDWRFFFGQFNEFWRILKPGGVLAGSVPHWGTKWAWGDPSHKRVINEGTFVFLDQREYEKQVGQTPMSDFHFVYHGDFEVDDLSIQQSGQDAFIYFVLKARKESSE